MAIPAKIMTTGEFDKWVFLPENTDKSFEYIGKEIIEKVSIWYSSLVAAEIGFHIRLHMREHNIKGHVTGTDGGYIVKGERYIPDIAYISAKRQKQASREAYNSNYPDLAIEVVSPTDREQDLTIKIGNYMAAGTVVWVVYPESKQVNIFVPGKSVKRLNESDSINGSPVFPDFELNVSEMFPEE